MQDVCISIEDAHLSRTAHKKNLMEVHTHAAEYSYCTHTHVYLEYRPIYFE